MLNYLREYIDSKQDRQITYADFIAQALYHPEYGYYMKEKLKIGREGDFITSSNVSNIYGQAIAKWFLRQVKENGLVPAICEIGAGTGRFAKAFIEEWNNHTSEVLTYYILETSPYHRKLQQEVIPFGDNIRQIESLEEITPFQGLIFSNELFDAFPVHVIERQDEQLMEVMITYEKDQLVEKLVPLSNKQIYTFLAESGLILANGQRIEIPLQMEGMIKQIAQTLGKGMVLTVDYGYTNEEWQAPWRREGSLRGYYQHQQMNTILDFPGNMDITSHIHFDSFIRLGNRYDLHFIQKWRQDEFLMLTGIIEELQENYDPDPFSEVSKRNRAIRSLILPSGMSSAFHVVLQTKGNEEK